jgi:NADH-quinone oxidoreductase subunit L
LFGGLINLPWGNLDFLSKFLAPMFHSTATAVTVSTGTKVALSAVTTVVALLGLGLGLRTWATASHSRLEPTFLRRAWYFDDLVAAVASGPLRAAANGLAFVMDRRIVDGTVNGVGRLLAVSGRVTRKVQNGYIRTYAVGIGVGLVIILAYLAFRTGS